MTWTYTMRDGETQTAMRFAKRIAATYADGKKTASAKLTMANLTPDKLERAFLVSRISEIAVCHFLGIHIIHSLDWSNECDRGWDLQFHDLFIDVKASETPNPRLIWPASKAHFIDEVNCDVFALCGVAMPRITLHGFCSLNRFRNNCVTSDGTDGLVKGTLWMRAEHITPPEDFKSMFPG